MEVEMVNDKTYRRLLMSVKKENSTEIAASKCGISDKTARKYLKAGKPPSELKQPHTWRTRKDPFLSIWDKAVRFLDINAGLEAKTLFEHIQKEHPGKYDDGQLRTFQRKVKEWKSIEGPPKEVFFPQIHHPGELCEADFTDMNKLNITINGERFDHMLFHFVLSYSNWETGTLCYSESFEALSEGLQNALWELGGIPIKIRTDNLSAAIYKDLSKKIFTDRYHDLIKHYRIHAESIQPGNPHENGDIEQRHYRIKKAVDQALMIRGSRNFESIDEYKAFLKHLFSQVNAGRLKRFKEELKKLKSLPNTKLDTFKEIRMRVGPSSTINVSHNTYSVDSRLIGECIKVHVKADSITIYYAYKKIDEFPRLRGEGKHKIRYWHIIHSLKRKPGAFENYRYKDDFFPTVHFRMAYDQYKQNDKRSATKKYLELLYIATTEGESKVDNALRILFERNEVIDNKKIKELILKDEIHYDPTEVHVSKVNLNLYDELMENREVLYG